MSNISTLPKPACTLSLIEISILDVIPYFDVVTDTKITSTLINGNVQTYNSSQILVKEYMSGDEYTRSTQFSKNISDSLGFSATVPRISFDLPGYTIDKFPYLKKGCNDAVNPEWPIVCGPPSVRKIRACRRVLGKKICISTFVPDFDKRLNEMYIDELKTSQVNLFTLEETVLKLKYKLIPNVETSTKVSASKTYGVTFGVGDVSINTGTKVLSFTLSKLVAGLSIQLEALEFTYGGAGINLKNISIPLLNNQDLLFGGSVTASIDSKGNIKAYYFIKQFKYSLLQLLVTPLAVPIGLSETDSVENIRTEAPGADDLAEKLPKVPNVWNNSCAPVYNALKKTLGVERAKSAFNKIIHFLKKTEIEVAVGLLLCPQMLPKQPNILSCVFTSTVGLEPFSGLDEVNKLKIPEDYIPEIPSIDANFFGADVVNDLTKGVNVVLNSATNAAEGVVNQAKNAVKGVAFDITSHIPVSIIPNPNFL